MVKPGHSLLPAHLLSKRLKLLLSVIQLPSKKANDIQVVLEVDNSLVTAYKHSERNQLPGAAFKSYSSNGLGSTMPGGNSGEYNLPLTLNKNNLNLQNAYAIGFKDQICKPGCDFCH